MMIFGRMLSIELINGCGLFLEFADSRAVWCAIIMRLAKPTPCPLKVCCCNLPFILISFGRVYEEVEQ
jgi:hypothetical protein